MQTINDVPMILRREIEARMITPFLDAFVAEFGKEKVFEIAEKIIAEQARQAGQAVCREREEAGAEPLPFFRDVVTPRFQQGGGIEFEIPEDSPTCHRMNVTYCKYAELYQQLGIAEKYGKLLSCMRDVYMIPEIGDNVTFTRTMTRMEGDPYCDFCLDTVSKK